MPIVPDDKDWTWVVERACPECGFDPAGVSAAGVADQVRANASLWRGLLDRVDVAVRPSDDRWSPLEYACHVRDVFLLFDHRLARMLSEDDPLFENWDQDATALEDRYGEQDAPTVVEALEAAGEALAARFDSVPDDAWSRPGRRSDGARFTVDTFARYLLHDPFHHVWDVSARRL